MNPVSPSRLPKAASDAGAGPPAPPAGRVLVVAGDDSTAESLRAMLSEAGVESLALRMPSAVLEHAREFRADAIVLDLQLEGRGGFDLARQFRRDSAFIRCALIAIGASDDAETRMRASAAGFDHYLLRPVRIDDLLAVLRGR